MIIPKIRNSIEVRQNNDELIFTDTQLGGRKIYDTDVNFRNLIRKIDGVKSIDNLYEELLQDGLEMEKESFIDIINKLLIERIIEENKDINKDDINNLTENERELFSRQINLWEAINHHRRSGYKVQEDLRNSRVALIGIGGIGSWTALFLAQAGIGNLTVIDFDSVEINNLSRQVLYRYEDIGNPKTVSLKKNINSIFPNMKVSAYDFKLTNETKNDLKEILSTEKVDFIINCSDFPDIKTTSDWVSEICFELEIPHIVGNGYNVKTAYVGPTIFPNNSPCWGCFSLQSFDRDMLSYPVLHEPVSKQQLSLSLAPSLIANKLSLEVIKHLSGQLPTGNIGKRQVIQLFDSDVEDQYFRRHPKCKFCGSDLENKLKRKK